MEKFSNSGQVRTQNADGMVHNIGFGCKDVGFFSDTTLTSAREEL